MTQPSGQRHFGSDPLITERTVLACEHPSIENVVFQQQRILGGKANHLGLSGPPSKVVKSST